MARAVGPRRVGHVQGRSAVRGPRDRHRPGERSRGHGRRQRRHREGRHVLPHHGEEAPSCAAGRPREPAPLRLPGRFRRRVPAAPGRGVPRPRSLRADLLQPGSHVRGAHRAGRRGDGVLHRGGRLRARDVGRDGDRPRDRHDLPRRTAARESSDRRGSDGRGTRRRGRSHAPLGRGRLPGGGRRARAPPRENHRLHAAHREGARRSTSPRPRTRATTPRNSTAW